MTTDEAKQVLEEYSSLEGSELGEYWSNLLAISRYSYCMSRGLRLAIEKEIILQAQRAKAEFTIVEEPSPPRKTRTLKHISEP